MTKASRPKRTRSAKTKPTTDVALPPAPAASDGDLAAKAAKAAKEERREVRKRFNVEMRLLQDANARKNAESARKDQKMKIVEDDAKQARFQRGVFFWVSLAGILVAFGVAGVFVFDPTAPAFLQISGRQWLAMRPGGVAWSIGAFGIQAVCSWICRPKGLRFADFTKVADMERNSRSGKRRKKG